jgi:hypothetical protein
MTCEPNFKVKVKSMKAGKKEASMIDKEYWQRCRNELENKYKVQGFKTTGSYNGVLARMAPWKIDPGNL